MIIMKGPYDYVGINNCSLRMIFLLFYIQQVVSTYTTER